ncbi:MAG: pilus assembly protein TadG-related protein [Anaerovoracaceae bacterium]|jgi:Flp pilus assembly protein TadG
MKRRNLIWTVCMSGILRNEKGSVIILVTLALTALLTMAALVVDVGIAYCHGSRLQNAADAAVFAGGRLLPAAEWDTDKLSAIEDRIREYLEKNGVSLEEIASIDFTDSIGGSYYGLQVSLNTQSETGFARVLGVDSIAVDKQAGVKVRPSLSADDVVPVSVVKDELDLLLEQGQTEHIILKYGGGDGSNGAFGAINLSGVKGGGANQYYNWILSGYTTEIAVGEKMYPIEPGNMAGPTSKAFNDRYASCTHFPEEGGCNLRRFEPTCRRVVKIPVVEYITAHDVQIVGFAVFILEDCYANGKAGEVQGSYVKTVINGTADYSADADLDREYGAYCLTLSR